MFSLASISLNRGEADQLLATIRTSQTSELKFARLRRSHSGRRRLIELLASSTLTDGNVVLSLYHKRFMTVAKMVDLLIKPLAKRGGLDLLQDGFNISYSNVLNICLSVFLGEQGMNRLLSAFINMFRSRTPESTRMFYGIAREIFERASETLAEPFAPVVASEEMIEEILAHNDRLSLDPAIPAFFQHCALWGDRFGGPFSLVHDESKPIFQDKEALESLMASDEEGQRIGYDRRAFHFPLRAQGIRFSNSKDDPRLQVADLIASAAASWAGARISQGNQVSLERELEAAGIERFIIGGIWPSDAISPSELGTEYTGGVMP